jgi:small nuclear ribonucleoprotein (snRNP)-like protein
MSYPMRKATTIVVLLLSFLLAPLSLAAQTAPTDWSRLNSLTGGTKLSVKLKDGKKVDGTFDSVSDSTLSLTVKNARKEIRREDVESVHGVSGKSATTSTLIGLGVGAGAGAAVGIAGDASNNDDGFEKIDNSIAAGITVLGAGVGALTGFILGKTQKKRVLLYVSK